MRAVCQLSRRKCCLQDHLKRQLDSTLKAANRAQRRLRDTADEDGDAVEDVSQLLEDAQHKHEDVRHEMAAHGVTVPKGRGAPEPVSPTLSGAGHRMVMERQISDIQEACQHFRVRFCGLRSAVSRTALHAQSSCFAVQNDTKTSKQHMHARRPSSSMGPNNIPRPQVQDMVDHERQHAAPNSAAPTDASPRSTCLATGSAGSSGSGSSYTGSETGSESGSSSEDDDGDGDEFGNAAAMTPRGVYVQRCLCAPASSAALQRMWCCCAV